MQRTGDNRTYYAATREGLSGLVKDANAKGVEGKQRILGKDIGGETFLYISPKGPSLVKRATGQYRAEKQSAREVIDTITLGHMERCAEREIVGSNNHDNPNLAGRWLPGDIDKDTKLEKAFKDIGKSLGVRGKGGAYRLRNLEACFACITKLDEMVKDIGRTPKQRLLWENLANDLASAAHWADAPPPQMFQRVSQSDAAMDDDAPSKLPDADDTRRSRSAVDEFDRSTSDGEPLSVSSWQDAQSRSEDDDSIEEVRDERPPGPVTPRADDKGKGPEREINRLAYASRQDGDGEEHSAEEFQNQSPSGPVTPRGDDGGSASNSDGGGAEQPDDRGYQDSAPIQTSTPNFRRVDTPRTFNGADTGRTLPRPLGTARGVKSAAEFRAEAERAAKEAERIRIYRRLRETPTRYGDVGPISILRRLASIVKTGQDGGMGVEEFRVQIESALERGFSDFNGVQAKLGGLDGFLNKAKEILGTGISDKRVLASFLTEAEEAYRAAEARVFSRLINDLQTELKQPGGIEKALKGADDFVRKASPLLENTLKDETSRKDSLEDLYRTTANKVLNAEELEDQSHVMHNGAAIPCFKLGDVVYTPVRQLGQGGFGAVFEVIGPNNERAVLKLPLENTEETRTAAGHEAYMHGLVATASEGEKSHVLGFKGALHLKNHGVGFVTELAAHKEMNDARYALQYALQDELITEDDAWQVRLKWMHETAKGLKQIHKSSEGIAHRDVKVENIFFVDGDVKVADFGTAAMGKSQPLRDWLLKIQSPHNVGIEVLYQKHLIEKGRQVYIENVSKIEEETLDKYRAAMAKSGGPDAYKTKLHTQELIRRKQRGLDTKKVVPVSPDKKMSTVFLDIKQTKAHKFAIEQQEATEITGRDTDMGGFATACGHILALPGYFISGSEAFMQEIAVAHRHAKGAVSVVAPRGMEIDEKGRFFKLEEVREIEDDGKEKVSQKKTFIPHLIGSSGNNDIDMLLTAMYSENPPTAEEIVKNSIFASVENKAEETKALTKKIVTLAPEGYERRVLENDLEGVRRMLRDPSSSAEKIDDLKSQQKSMQDRIDVITKTWRSRLAELARAQ